MQNGLREVDVHASVLHPGDYLAVARDLDHQALEAPPLLRLVGTDTQGRPLLSLFCTGRPLRFYNAPPTLGPWSLSIKCQNHIDVFEVEPAPISPGHLR